ncbi:energy transducer TonB [Bacteroides sp. GD17]|jgi:TonB family protein|uniref:energy transducer TonB family protein n=1 Tax=Bacteroides sp. GD17 TaxID=3139826 RepID=UPI0025F3F052|nr:energy transducer TonB [uncultured Bacteroides sp.]
MVNQKKEGRYIGIVGALLVHAAIIALLILVGFTLPEPSEEDGIPVMLGEVPDALGAADPSLVKVDVMPEEVAPPAPQPQETVEQEIITQETEETVAIKPKAEPKKKELVKKPEKTEAEKAEEARKLAEAKAERERKEAEARAERERKAAEEAARKRVAGAFGKGAQMGDKGDTKGEGIQGSPTGNAATGATTGTGGYGTFNLGGRSIGEGGLPRPVYNVQDEGRVVVTITVNPAGHVIATSINRQTNTVNPALRKAAEDAARKARFNAVSGLNNQTGTITYYFNLK